MITSLRLLFFVLAYLVIMWFLFEITATVSEAIAIYLTSLYVSTR